MPANLDIPPVTAFTVEAAYKRAITMRCHHASYENRPYCELWRARGVRLARVRDDRLLKWLGLAADRLYELQAPQVSRFKQEGFDQHAELSGEFTEFASFKQALLLVDERKERDGVQAGIFGWVYGAAAEAVYGRM